MSSGSQGGSVAAAQQTCPARPQQGPRGGLRKHLCPSRRGPCSHRDERLWTHSGISSRSCLLISPDLRETNISSPHRPHQRMEQTSGLIRRSRAALGTLSPFRDLGSPLWPPLLLLLVDPPLASDPLATLYLRNRVLDTWTEAPLLPQSLSQPLPPPLLQKENKRSEFRSCLESGRTSYLQG